MTEFEVVARGQRAKALLDEFLGPILEGNLAEYQSRLVHVATTELNPAKRAEKITALSTAIVVLNNIKAGIEAAVFDGVSAEKSLLKVEHIEKMTAPKRRIFDIAPRL